MFIGFSERAVFVREDRFGNTIPLFPLGLTIHSSQMSEMWYSIMVSVGEGTATVTTDSLRDGDWDASFGASHLSSRVITNYYDLFPGQTEMAYVQTLIRNDNAAENNETFTLRVSRPCYYTAEHFECYDEDEDPIEGNYFCTVTITIVDDDGKYM